ncbi:MAG: hypothetical protein K2K24_02335, partial [Clostridia bacterium]|nr:hypothetical protein [Clostridia bacterium]
TYSFVSVVKGQENKLFKLKGIVLGKRAITIQEAKEEEKPASKESNNFKSKKPSDKKGKKDFVNKNSKSGKQTKKSTSKTKGNKPVSRKSKFYSQDE